MDRRASSGSPGVELLYVSYDGLTDPLGRSQILPYLIGCAEQGHAITALTAEKPDRLAADANEVSRICADAEIDWQPLRYHRRPPVLSTLYDLAAMRRRAVHLHRRHHFALAHCRSYIPASIGLHLKRHFGVPLLFDMRGFWPDEKIEGRGWNIGNPLFRRVYAHFKRLEAQLLREADAIVVLTDAAKAELLARGDLAAGATVTVIPCCVDFEHFPLVSRETRAQARRQLGIAEDASVLAYLGSLGGNYMLSEMLDFYRQFRARYAGCRFLFITLHDEQAIRTAAAEQGIAPDEIVVRAASRGEVPQLLAGADLGVAFKQASYSAKGCSPTKLGEMLAMGIPVVANAGVGDVAQILAATCGGAAVSKFSAESYEDAIDRIEGEPLEPAVLRERALAIFDAQRAVVEYSRLYHQLGGKSALPPA